MWMRYGSIFALLVAWFIAVLIALLLSGRRFT
jgi:hypothetical protein